MPKIAKESMSYMVQGASQGLAFDINFSDDTFFVDIPAQYQGEFDVMPEKYQVKYFIRYIHLRGGKSKYAVYADTKKDVVSRFKNFIEYIANKTTEKEPIIVIDKNFEIHEGQECWLTGPGLKIQFQYFIGYRVLVNIREKMPNKYKYFSVYQPHKEGSFMNGQVTEMRISWYKESLLILPDTPENREKVIGLSDALLKLRNGLDDLMKTENKLLSSIKSFKLLPGISK